MNNRPNCRLCGEQDNQSLFSHKKYTLNSCNNCELLFIDPYPPEITEVHNRVSDHSKHEMKIVNPESDLQSATLYFKNYLPKLKKICKGANSVLDVGCGTGYLLQQFGLSEDFYRCGIELNHGRAEKARSISGCEIHEVPLEKFNSERKFDVIILMNVLSHIHSFDKLFEAVSNLLSENGKVIFKVGEFRKEAKKSDIIDWEIPDHLHFLGHNTMNFICQKYNFTLDSHDRVPYSSYLFSRDRWNAIGRSNFRNMIKKIIVNTPFALKTLEMIFNLTRGKETYSSFIVISANSK